MTDTATAHATDLHVYRFEIHPTHGEADPRADALLADAAAVLGSATAAHTARIFLIEAPISAAQAQHIAEHLLADPINQRVVAGASAKPADGVSVEVHYQPGVMDPVAESTREAIAEMLPEVPQAAISVLTGFRFDLQGLTADEGKLRQFAERYLANPVIQHIHLTPHQPAAFAHGGKYSMRVTEIPLRELDDAGLQKMSREAHLFLSLAEMRAVRDYYIDAGREPTDIELETLAQTWSEHCVHKTLKSTIRYTPGPGTKATTLVPGSTLHDLATRPGHHVNDDGSVTIRNLLKSTVAAATHELMQDSDIGRWCVSVFTDNAGIVRFDEEDAVCIKVETHNHPSAIEPYGGAATGIGGCIRDIMGTGLAARPIANTDVFAVAFPDTAELPKGVIHPKRVLQQVVAGVRDYGNRMGIPTINGAVWFHQDYLGNPLVFAGCVGIIPADKAFGSAQPGDRIIALGGRTGRDGIHGATFSSAELTDTHADEFSHAVQIGNAITQKKTLDVILQARDYTGGPLFSAITDCGAGGFSSAVGEMGEKVGAYVQLERAPLKYDGLSYTEIWISEAQERMVLAVPAENVDKLEALCAAEGVEMCDLGQFGCDPSGPVMSPVSKPQLILTYHGDEVGRLSMHLLHDGIPTPTREATGPAASPAVASNATAASPKIRLKPDATVGDLLLGLLSHPNIASKHWIIRQYDHEVQGGSVVKPLVGPQQNGPSDASVIRPKLASERGVAIGCGLQTGMGEHSASTQGDAYWMTLAAIDEAVRNVVCVGADPKRIAILDNFCWPKCEDPARLGQLVRAAEACYDGAKAYRTPFVSGKDSLNNQFTTEDGKVVSIPPTLLITAMGIVPDIRRARTMDAKKAGHVLILVGETTSAMGGSHYMAITSDTTRDASIPRTSLQGGPRNAHAVASLIAAKRVAAAHDCSDGGLLVAAAEMAFAGGLGVNIDLDAVAADRELDDITACFAETPSRYLLEVAPGDLDDVLKALRADGIPFGQVGTFTHTDHVAVRCGKHGQIAKVSIDDLRTAWLKPLDW
jgi:phosphoribosylformylglycinamidine synthase